MVPTLVVILALSVLYWFPIRRAMSRWGATPFDLTREMAGDGLLVNPTYSGTTAVVVDAPPEHIWPWLVQMGYRRGGLYSYDWLDRLFGYLDRPSATRILPELQRLGVGDRIPLGRGPHWPVAAVETNHALVLDMRNLGGVDWVWQFGLYPLNEKQTQLVSRSRVSTRTLWARLLTYAIEPAGFLMTRRMLLGLKQRAEALHAASTTQTRGAQRTAA
ncbi:MAG TPA: hypothetical protein VFP91_12835 [Vicinamibacterales bacterium]|nr:hypothetical protein [Vicinamibacterales bacterium]